MDDTPDRAALPAVSDTPSPEEESTEDIAADDERATNSDAGKSMIDVGLAPIGLEPRGLAAFDEPKIATTEFVENGGKHVVIQVWEGENEPSGITFISDIRFEFDSARGAEDFLAAAQAELTAFSSEFTGKTIQKRFTYMWATGHLVAYIVIGGRESMEETDARQGAVLVELNMETITKTDSNRDGEIGASG